MGFKVLFPQQASPLKKQGNPPYFCLLHQKEQISVCLYILPHIGPCLLLLPQEVMMKYGLIAHMTLALTSLAK